MLRDRIAIAILLIPVALWSIYTGGWPYLAGVLLIFYFAAHEYVLLFRHVQLRPSMPLVLAGVGALLVARFLDPLGLERAVWAGLIVAALAWHLLDYERGASTSGTDFAVTLAGIAYLGGLGSFFISLRQIPDGAWWTLTALPGVWLADTGAYTFGRLFGRHRMAPRLSPKKTWEGYAGGILGGALGTGALAYVWHIGAGPDSQVTALNGLVLGALIGAISPIGDLGVSMIKRQIGIKDSGQLLAGHGGALDRMDSWLVAVVIGYYAALFFMR